MRKRNLFIEKKSSTPWLGGVFLLLATLLVGVVIWISVQAFRTDSLPTLIYSPKLSVAELMEKSPLVLNNLGDNWWWVYANKVERARLKESGVSLALAMPTPIAAMAGCSIPAMPAQLPNP